MEDEMCGDHDNAPYLLQKKYLLSIYLLHLWVRWGLISVKVAHIKKPS